MRQAISHEAATAILGSTSLFAGLDEPALHGLAAASTQRTYGKGQYLWYEGDDGDRLMVVASGLLKVLLTSEQGDDVVLNTLGKNETIGELAVLDGSPRSASVVAVESTTVLMLTRATVLELMARHPPVLDAVLRSLADLVRRLTEQNSDLILLDLGGRLAKLLLRLARGQAPTHGDAVVLELGLSQSELAAMVGATRPAVNRALQLLASRGLIALNGRVIVLRDLPGLRRRAGI
jgi:CRP/FNR family transcriptional regulator, cyclic AMP receptor protein